MKPIRIDQDEKLEAALEEVQAGKYVRVLTVAEIQRAAIAAEERLADAGIAKKYRGGSRAVIDPWILPRSYKYGALGTVVLLRRGSRDWFVASISRESVRIRSYAKGDTDIAVYANATKEIVEGVLRKTGVIFTPPPVAS